MWIWTATLHKKIPEYWSDGQTDSVRNYDIKLPLQTGQKLPWKYCLRSWFSQCFWILDHLMPGEDKKVYIYGKKKIASRMLSDSQNRTKRASSIWKSYIKKLTLRTSFFYFEYFINCAKNITKLKELSRIDIKGFSRNRPSSYSKNESGSSYIFTPF